MDIAIVLLLLSITLVLFARETWPVDLTVLVMLLVLMVCGILTPKEAFAGFSSDLLVILASVFVIGGALQETGVLEGLAARMSRWAAGSRTRLLGGTVLSAAGLSAIMNNTTVTALFVAPVTTLARRTGVSPSVHR